MDLNLQRLSCHTRTIILVPITCSRVTTGRQELNSRFSLRNYTKRLRLFDGVEKKMADDVKKSIVQITTKLSFAIKTLLLRITS